MIYQDTHTRYVQTIDAIDATTDRITVSTRQPGATTSAPAPGPSDSFSFPVPKPHDFHTGDQVTYAIQITAGAP